MMSIVSYLTARPARDIVIAGRQQATRDWWETAPTRFELVVSQLVREEAALGDPEAARVRLAALAPLTALAAPVEALELSRRLVDSAAVPKRAARDATHVAIAGAWRRISGDLELPPHSERRIQAADRVNLPSIRRRTPCAVHS